MNTNFKASGERADGAGFKIARLYYMEKQSDIDDGMGRRFGILKPATGIFR